MFSPFGASTRSSSPAPAYNPFASKPADTGSPFGFGDASSLNQAKTGKLDNPFAQNSESDSGAKSFNPFAGSKPIQTNGTTETKNDDSKTTAFAKNGQHKTGNGPKISFGQFKGQGGGFDSKPSSTGSSTPFASASEDESAATITTSDRHAKKVYEQLRKDNIRPPAWPSQPGDPKNKTQMAKFREQYEEYRSKVRASLTSAGLIDDPSKRRTLQDAIDFRGICEDMCPEFEKITRITEFDVPQPERDPATTFPSTKRMVKKLARSAAGQEAPLPMDVLSVPTLRKTLDYLVDNLLQNDGNLPALHGYLWDRTRAIRRDFSFFSTPTAEDIKAQTYVLENIARFHVTSLHLLSQSGRAPEDFVEQQELEQLSKALLTLRDIYDDCAAQGLPCENEAEFRALYLVFHANDPNIMEILQRQWRPSLWHDSDHVRTAVSLVEALHNTQDFHGPLKGAPSLAASSAHLAFFRIVEDPKVSYTMACFAECHFPQLRRAILRNVKRGLARPKGATQDFTAETLNTFLRFDTVQEAIDFAELHDLAFTANSEDPSNASAQYLVIEDRAPLPHHRLQHHFSQNLVEKKRGSHSLPDIIHRTIYEDPSSKTPLSNGGEPSLFVRDNSKKTVQNTPPTTSNTPFGHPSAPSPFSGNGNQSKEEPAAPPAQTRQTAPSPFAPTGSSGTANRPFAPSTASPFGLGANANTTATPAASSPFGAKQNTSETQAAQAKPTFSFGAASGEGKQATSNTASSFQLSASNAPFGAPASAGPNLPKTSPPAQKDTLATQAPSFGFPPSTANAEPSKSESTNPQQLLPPLNSSPFQASVSSATPSALTAFATDKPSKSHSEAAPGLKDANPVAPTADLGTVTSAAAGRDGGLSFSASAKTSAPSFKSPAPTVPPRDLMKDFTEWFVNGDSGLLSEFQQHYLDGLLAPVFLKWQKQVEKERVMEEARRDDEKSTNFRRNSLSLRYFYRWKVNAREKRLKFLRRSGRDQLRKFYQAQHAGLRRTSAESVSRPNSPESPTSRASHQKSLMEGLRLRQANKQYRPLNQSTLDVSKQRDPSSAVIGHFNLPQSPMAASARSRSSSVSRGGAKTRALREELLGSSHAGFGRSLPSVASGERSSPDSVRSSKVSERWRLKAMGIVQLPDGTAVPESLMDDRRFNRTKRASSITNLPTRRPSMSGMSSYGGYTSTFPDHGSTVLDDAGPSNKRKRVSEDDAGLLESESNTRNNSHKRVMSDAESLIQELRALREEMEEGTMWFKSQNNKLQGEIASRGGTPLDESI